METPQLADGIVLEKAFLRRVLGAFATGVTVVTAGGKVPHGMTANSFTSVSLDPPLILVCVGRDAFMHTVLTRQTTFAVSILAADQAEVARYFADRRRPVGRTEFDTVSWSPGTHSGAPLIDGALAHLECEVEYRHETGDHTIYVGRLLSLSRRPGSDALLFLNGQFLRADRRPDPALAGPTVQPRRPGPADAA